jgi:predicted N-acetyltransferase YhbS
MDFEILPQRPQDPDPFDSLLDRAFGPERLSKTVYRLREGIAALPDLRFVAVDQGGTLLASLRFWPVMIERTPAILLGPLAVEPHLQGQGIGKALVRHGLAEARCLGYRICIVVGEPEYYGPYGFVNAAGRPAPFPGPGDRSWRARGAAGIGPARRAGGGPARRARLRSGGLKSTRIVVVGCAKREPVVRESVPARLGPGVPPAVLPLRSAQRSN